MTTFKEVDMFARNVSFHLKSNMLSDYTRAFDKEVLPLLRKQSGFKDAITFSSSGGTEVTAISLWDNKANAEAYKTNAYPEVVKTLAKVIDGKPKVQTGEVVNSTFHKIVAAVAA
jgi:heme-degrading monooxygenase HmoA